MSDTPPIPQLALRPATVTDVPLVYSMIRELAEYENLANDVTATEADIHAALFGERAIAECILAYWEERPAGFALYFHNFSTFMGKPGLYLEDMFVRPEHRGKGIGQALLVHLARVAKERNCGRMEWSVLDWNDPAINFYRRLGARPMDEWRIFRLQGDALETLAGGGEKQ